MAAGYALLAYSAVQWVGSMLDEDGKYTLEIDALSYGAAAGAAAWYLATEGIIGTAATAGPIGWVVGVVVTIIAYLAGRDKQTKQIDIRFQCLPWQAPLGGENCELCNKDENVPCSEYRCKSLGQGCGIINAGTSKEKCIWLNPKDATSPGIKPLDSAITEGYVYTNVVERPAGSRGGGISGMRIAKQGGGCIDAFTLVEFGIEASEEAQCKISHKHTQRYRDMGYYFGADNMYKTDHKDKLSMPGVSLVNSINPEKEYDGEHELYVRCRDGNGNENVDEFVISFCVDKGPDLTAPIIKSTSINNNGYVQYNTDQTQLGVYVNEPSTCRWSRKDASYSNMDNNMICSDNVWEMNTDLLYTCIANLTGIENGKDNNFYFRCTDLSNNSMQQSYPFTLKGSQPLDIIEVGPTETVGGSTTTVTATLEVSTDNGANNGEAICFFSTTGLEEDYIQFFDTASNKHSQDLDLGAGSYKYYIKCEDLGGNTDYDQVEFDVVVDTSMPRVVRAYNENEKVKVVTSEEAECRYSAESCNFGFTEGIEMPDDGSEINHYAEWITGQSYYIKCGDIYGNVPDPSICSIIVRPSSI